MVLVSIHAPARGATRGERIAAVEVVVSIHAPARGATPALLRDCRQVWRFDPRPCARGDSRGRSCSTSCKSFDPRPCARGDREADDDHAASAVSIHAPARGATIGWQAAYARRQFRSTPLREGRHAGALASIVGEGVSIHAPARGATPEPGGVAVLEMVSIHAPARGATANIFFFVSSVMFRSTPLREGRPCG